MINIIKKVRVNDKQLEILLNHKDKQFQLKKDVHADLFPPLVDSLRQIRELTQNIALISGGIAAFIIPVMNTSFVQVKALGYFSLVNLFATLCYAIYHLTEVIPKEVNELSNQHSTYMAILDDEIDHVNKIIESGDIDDFVRDEEESQKILNQLNKLKTIPRPDKSLDVLRTLLIIALCSLTISFIPVSTFQKYG